METLKLQEEGSTTQLVEAVYKGPGDQRLEAERTLLDGNPLRTDALLEVLIRENKKKAKRFGFIAAGFLVGFIALLGLLEFALSGDGPNIGGFGYPMWMAAAGIAAYYAPTKLQKKAAKALSESNDIRAVPPLIEALDKQDSATRNEALKALIRLLPRLRADHDEMLTDHQMNVLRDQINKGDKDFAPAALKAVQQIGDERFLSTVKTWSEGKGSAKKSGVLRDAGSECLPFLEERVQRQKASQTLLRAASAGSADTTALLRPAGSNAGDSSLLIRPAEAESTALIESRLAEEDQQVIRHS